MFNETTYSNPEILHNVFGVEIFEIQIASDLILPVEKKLFRKEVK